MERRAAAAECSQSGSRGHSLAALTAFAACSPALPDGSLQTFVSELLTSADLLCSLCSLVAAPGLLQMSSAWMQTYSAFRRSPTFDSDDGPEAPIKVIPTWLDMLDQLGDGRLMQDFSLPRSWQLQRAAEHNEWVDLPYDNGLTPPAQACSRQVLEATIKEKISDQMASLGESLQQLVQEHYGAGFAQLESESNLLRSAKLRADLLFERAEKRARKAETMSWELQNQLDAIKQQRSMESAAHAQAMQRLERDMQRLREEDSHLQLQMAKQQAEHERAVQQLQEQHEAALAKAQRIHRLE